MSAAEAASSGDVWSLHDVLRPEVLFVAENFTAYGKEDEVADAKVEFFCFRNDAIDFGAIGESHFTAC